MNSGLSKILVTGGTGYIGSHTVVELQQAGFEVVIVDNLSNSSIAVLDGIIRITGIKPHFTQIDCLDYDGLSEVFNAHPEIRAVIHFAASKAVGESIQQPLHYYRNNLQSLLNLLEIMIGKGVSNLVFSSSCTVYGQPEHLPVTEDSPIQPAISPYGNTKQICEEIIRDTAHSGVAIKSILLRYFNPIGAHPTAAIGEQPSGVPQNLVPLITQTAAGIRKKLLVFGNNYHTPDGSCIRDYISVVDLAKAHVAACRRLISNLSSEKVEAFNIGMGKGLSVLELVHLFRRITGIDFPYEITGRREGDIEQIWADTHKANTVLGWTAKENIADTLFSAWKWEQKQIKK